MFLSVIRKIYTLQIEAQETAAIEKKPIQNRYFKCVKCTILLEPLELSYVMGRNSFPCLFPSREVKIIENEHTNKTDVINKNKPREHQSDATI